MSGLAELGEITDVTFADAVLKADAVVLVEFWAPWARDCSLAEPPLRVAAESLGDAVRLVRLNVEKNPVAAVVYGVHRIPSVLVFRGGRDVDRWSKALPVQEIVDRIRGSGDGTRT